MYNIRLLTEDDYPVLCEWWKFWRFPAPPREFLPNNGTGGIMISKDGIDICAGFLYGTNSRLAWLEYIVSNPKYRDNRAGAIQYLISELTRLAKETGYGAVFTSVKNENLVKHYEACGYFKGSNNTYEMVISI